jgi:hypothetical protein
MDSEDPGQVSPVADPGLADQARRRLARQAGNPANGAAAAAGCGGPLAAAVLDSQQRAITLARNATEARVGALESYAVQVQAADAAQQDFVISVH